MEDYPGSKKDGRKFKENLLSFWDALVCESQEAALFDQQLMDKCMDYTIALSWYVSPFFSSFPFLHCLLEVAGKRGCI